MNLAFKTILFATDFSDASDLALEYARVLAARFGAGLHVLHVVQTPIPLGSEMYVPDVMTVAERAVEDAQQHLTAVLRRIHGLEVIGQVLVGLAPKKIVEYAADHDVDLIVIGTHGRGALAHLLMGSVAERVVRTAPCPVFTVRDTAAVRRAFDRNHGHCRRHRVLILSRPAICGAALAAADALKIVPRVLADGVVLNVPQRMLFVKHEGDVAANYPRRR